MPLLEFTDRGIFCPAGDFYVDPWRPVDRAVVTHAHADHARWGMRHYLAHQDSEAVLRLRLGEDISLQTVPFGEQVQHNGVKVSLHPAGHIVGSAQVRVERKGEVWVVSGDYKLEQDALAQAFEPVECHAFITESTFGLPIYRWRPQAEIFAQINDWWRQNAAAGKNTVLFGYSLGKAQRLLAGVDPSIGPIYAHGAIVNTNRRLEDRFPVLKNCLPVPPDTKKGHIKGALVMAPPSTQGSKWLNRFAPLTTGIASGWMALRGARRRRAVDRGFVLSDHADWDGLIRAVEATRAERVYVTHGYSATFARYLNETLPGLQAAEVETLFEGELAEIGEGQQKERNESAD